MLIVNADDLGRTKLATENALLCHARGRISSTSAMVFMEDSERAAKLALQAGIDVGLHINFSEKFTAGSVPPELCRAQERVRHFLKSSKYALLFYNPILRKQFREVFEAQYLEFTRLYGRNPSHFDGHQHMHLASNVLMEGILPPGTKVRKSFSFRPGEKNLINRCYRAAVDRCLAKRHRVTDYFFALSQHLIWPRFQRIAHLAREADVEISAHPELKKEYDLLMSEDYDLALGKLRLGSYAEL